MDPAEKHFLSGQVTGSDPSDTLTTQAPRDGERERGREGERERGREGERERGREGERERGREGEREGGREGGRDYQKHDHN